MAPPRCTFQVSVDANIHAATVAAGAGLRPLLASMTTSDREACWSAISGIANVFLNPFAIMDLLRHPDDSAMPLLQYFWQRASEYRSLESAVQTLRLARMSGAYQWVNALLVGSALRANLSLTAPSGVLTTRYPELQRTWEQSLGSIILQQYAAEQLNSTGNALHMDAALGQISRKVSDFSQFLQKATTLNVITDSEMRDIVLGGGLVAHLRGFAEGRVGFTATRGLECAAVLARGWVQLRGSCGNERLNEVVIKETWAVMLAFHRQASAISDLLALTSIEREMAMHQYQAGQVLQGPQNLESLVQAEKEAAPEQMNGEPFSFSGVLFFEGAVHNCMTSMYAMLPFIDGSQG